MRGLQGEASSFIPIARLWRDTAQNANRWFVVLDGAVGREYDAIGKGPIFSPNGKRVAYSAQRGAKWSVVVDGVPGGEYDGIGEGTPIFSPDSKRVAYTAKQGTRWLVIVDGTEYAEENVGDLAFTPSNRHIAYVAKRGDKWVIVVDGIEASTFDGHARGATLVFDASDSFSTVVLRKREVSHDLSRVLMEVEFFCVTTNIVEE